MAQDIEAPSQRIATLPRQALNAAMQKVLGENGDASLRYGRECLNPAQVRSLMGEDHVVDVARGLRLQELTASQHPRAESPVAGGGD